MTDKHDKPVAWRSMEGSQYSLHHWAVDPYPESGPRIYRAAMAAARPPREPLYPASVVASLTAQRDAALARVAELEETLEECSGNINPERGFAEELEAEIRSVLNKGEQNR